MPSMWHQCDTLKCKNAINAFEMQIDFKSLITRVTRNSKRENLTLRNLLRPLGEKSLKEACSIEKSSKDPKWQRKKTYFLSPVFFSKNK